MRVFYLIYLLGSAIAIGLNACQFFLEEKNPPTLNPDFYGTQQGVESALTAVYAYMRWGAGDERYNVLTEYGTDLFTQGEDPGPYAAGFNQYGSQLNPDAMVLYQLWENHYKAIGTANLVIQQAMGSTELSESQKVAAVAEMSFGRAMFYFELVQQFGSIPLVLDVAFEARTDFRRSPISSIYGQIINDLRYATENLPVNPSATGRASRYAAAHLLSKVYLTRGSAVNEARGQQSADIDSALFYAKQVIESQRYSLQPNFADLWDIGNQGNSEIIFSVQFTTNLVFNGDGNTFHMYWGSWYEDQPGMQRDLVNGRPFRRHRSTNKTMFELFDRKNDSRFYKSFKWTYYANREAPGIAIGDTAIYYSLLSPTGTHPYRYFTWNRENPNQNNRYYPALLKYLDPNRVAVNEAKGSREWIRMRLGETYLLAAEAMGRLGDYQGAADYINVLRERAAWHDGEEKMPQYWKEEGGEMGNTESTYPEISVSPADISTDFVLFMLNERARELLGETNRWEDLVRCERLEDLVRPFNPEAINLRPFHKYRPIPQQHIDRLNPQGTIEEEQNEGYY
ncbi:RagB/SusD family nutrient uptake outer membrane protein [Olivibacter sitiensis]|uniref:RagB/SusD family nutrient uptake outer membrane protein n=1 Tax=Olivibacter sitiensis TaxID=376470 RepID=UPI001B7FBC2A|nr:RagB/SusD family nutrient uptake outer membrane protein [Olivibacter sitiensis]